MGTGGATITRYGHACVDVRTPGGRTILAGTPAGARHELDERGLRGVVHDWAPRDGTRA